MTNPKRAAPGGRRAPSRNGKSKSTSSTTAASSTKKPVATPAAATTTTTATSGGRAPPPAGARKPPGPGAPRPQPTQPKSETTTTTTEEAKPATVPVPAPRNKPAAPASSSSSPSTSTEDSKPKVSPRGPATTTATTANTDSKPTDDNKTNVVKPKSASTSNKAAPRVTPNTTTTNNNNTSKTTPTHWPDNLPPFDEFCNQLVTIFEDVKKNKSTGEVSNDIVTIGSSSNQESFGFSICTIDGSLFNYGDSDTYSTLQNLSSLFSYLTTSDEIGGSDKLNNVIGLDKKTISPLSVTGSLFALNLLFNKKDSITKLMEKITNAAGGHVSFNLLNYISSLQNSPKDYALAYNLVRNKLHTYYIIYT